MNPGPHAKALSILLLGVPAWGASAQAGGISAGEWWALVAIAASAALVWVVPNAAASDGPAPPEPEWTPPTLGVKPDAPLPPVLEG